MVSVRSNYHPVVVNHGIWDSGEETDWLCWKPRLNPEAVGNSNDGAYELDWTNSPRLLNCRAVRWYQGPREISGKLYVLPGGIMALIRCLSLHMSQVSQYPEHPLSDRVDYSTTTRIVVVRWIFVTMELSRLTCKIWQRPLGLKDTR